MPDAVKETFVIFVFFVLPGLIGGWIASTKGRSMIGWFLLCCFFPPTLMVIISQGPAREVPGHYRSCPACGELVKWREASCRYCGKEFAPPSS